MENSENMEKKELCENEIKVTEDLWYRIDMYMLSSKAAYCLSESKEACYAPFIIIYLNSIGLSPAEAGMINGYRLLAAIAGSIIWTMLADYTKGHSIIVKGLCIISTLFVCSQPFVSVSLASKEINVCPYNGNRTSAETALNTKNSNLFYTMLGINAISSLFDGGIAGFIDSAVMQKISLSPKRREFGNQRWIGAVGFASSSFITGVIPDYFPHIAVSCYSAVFCIYLVTMVILVICLQFLFKNLSFKSKKTNANYNLKQLLIYIFFQRRILFFFMTLLVMGVETGFNLSFFILYLTEKNAPTVLLGLGVGGVGSVSSMICIFNNNRFINLFGGKQNTMVICCFSYFVRYLSMAYLENVWLVLPIQALQGFGFGLFLSVSIQYAKTISTPEIATTIYGIRNALHLGLGPFIINLAGGQFYTSFGGKNLFIAGSVLALLWSMLMTTVLLMEFMFRKNNSTSQNEKNHGNNEVVSLELLGY